MADVFNLEGKKAIVTGGARGLSYGIAEGLHEYGAEVVLIDILDDVEASAEELGREGAKAYAVKGDMSDLDDLTRAFHEALKLLGGRLDILVNGAGVQHRCEAKDFPAEQWYRVININLNATFFMAQLAGRVMLEQGGGSIVNIASMNSFFGGVLVPAYVASKGGVAQVTKALSNEWGGKGVRVNAIAPGYMVTDMTATMRTFPKQVEDTSARIPMGRWGTPEDLKYVAVFLASQASSYINGAVIPVDGGYLGR